jgi:hypothetical protein
MAGKLDEIRVGTELMDRKTSTVYQWDGENWIPQYRIGQSIPKYLVDRAVAGFVDLPFVPSQIKEYVDKRAKQYAPPPGTWAHTAGDVAEFAGGLVPYGSAWKWSTKGLTKLPWLKKAVTSSWFSGLPQRIATGAGAGIISDLVTHGHKMSPEEIAYSALGGGLVGAVFPGSVGRRKIPPMVGEASPSVTAKIPGDSANIAKTVQEDLELLSKEMSPTVSEAASVTEAPVPTQAPTPIQAPTPTQTPTPTQAPAPPPFMQTQHQPWPPRSRYGPGFGNVGQSSETFPYITSDEATKLIEQIYRITAKEASKAASNLKKPLKGKRTVVIGGVPLLLDEDDIINYYVNQITNQE